MNELLVFSDIWHALQREASFAAESMASGATTLGRTNSARSANYVQAFFGLSTGLERSTKIALYLEHLASHGEHLNNGTLKDYGHDLKRLLSRMDQIGEQLAISGKGARLPDTEIHKNIVQGLSNFSTNLTRYYNLEFLTQDGNKIKSHDPTEWWHLHVTQPILEKHITERAKNTISLNAEIMESWIGSCMFRGYVSETGDPIATIREIMIHDGALQRAMPWARLYVLQICRFVATIVSDLSCILSMQLNRDIPQMEEIFRIFLVEDRYLKSRKTWSIYSP